MNSIPFGIFALGQKLVVAFAKASGTFEQIVPNLDRAILVLLLALVFAVLGVFISAYVYIVGRKQNVSLWEAFTSLLSMIWIIPVLVVLAYVSAQIVPYFREGGAEVPEAILGEEAEIPEAAIDGDDATKQIAITTSEPEDSKKLVIDSGPLPVWVTTTFDSDKKSKSKESESVKLVVVKSKQYLTTELAEQDSLQQARQLVRERFHKIHSPSGHWVIPTSLVKSATVKNQHLEKVVRDLGPMAENVSMYRAYMQLDLSSKTLETFFPVWREQIVERRLWALGALFGMITLLLGTVTSYMRLDTATGGTYRRRLKLASVSVIVAGGLAIGALLPAVA